MSVRKAGNSAAFSIMAITTFVEQVFYNYIIPTAILWVKHIKLIPYYNRERR